MAARSARDFAAIASPRLYALYINGVVAALKEANVRLGLTQDGVWAGILLYADDMVLLAPSPQELQEMINVVEKYSNDWRFELSIPSQR